MKALQFKGLLQKDQWIKPAYVELDGQGKILSISKTKNKEISYKKIKGFAVPGLQNAHSHAFQYAMVGLTEYHELNNARDDFWAWRKAMYQLALSINPDQMEAIATMLYTEMLRHGYTEVAEFHYIHQDLSGASYNNKAELGARLIAAAKKVGIKITLIPVFYQKGGFGKEATAGQLRFLSKDMEDYLELLASSILAVKYYEGASIGASVHSMRAVDPPIIKKITAHINSTMPFHMHISEQLKEIEASIAYLGKRPVEWLTEEIDLNETYHLVHATHLTVEETKALARSKANAVLCPSTEGNLGDGIFPLGLYQEEGGNWSIGTDSHIGINPFEELRFLDYRQRVTTHQRNIFTDTNQNDSGLYAINKLVLNGRKAMGKETTNFFEIGQSFDALVLDATVPILANCAPKYLASTIVYASDVSMYLGTIVNGVWVIKRGKHPLQKEINKLFSNCLKALKNRR